MTRIAPKALFLYLAFVVYGSLIPFDFQPRSLAEAWAAFLGIPRLQLGVTSRADLVANFLLYLPLGFLASASLGRGTPLKWLAAALGCAAVAVTVEFAQLFFRPRTVSLNDLDAEVLGAIFGATLWPLVSAPLGRWCETLVKGDTAATRALLRGYLLAYLLLSFFPFDFLVSYAELQWKLGTDSYHLVLAPAHCAAPAQCAGKLVVETLGAIPIGVLLSLVATHLPSRFSVALLLGALLGVALEALQLLIASGVSQGISVLTRSLGVGVGFMLGDALSLGWLRRLRQPSARVWMAPTALLYVALFAWLSWSGKGGWLAWEDGLSRIHEVRFLPFYYHYFVSESVAFASALYHAAFYFPLGLLCWLWHSRRSAKLLAAAWGASPAVVIETGKLFLAQTHPDPTNVWIAAGSAVAGLALSDWLAHIGRAPPAREPAHARSPRPARMFAGLLLVTAIALGASLGLRAPREKLVDEGSLPQLPAPHELAPAVLPAFRHAHPRLPAPSLEEIALLRQKNPGYLEHQRRAAQGGGGDLHASILLAYIEPGTQDLELLHRRLTALKFSSRGHEQVKPLAVAYDWLHHLWSNPQRSALRGKLAEGCHYLIGFIREARLSPYNVILYNSPLQALMACAIALYGDDPRGEPVMAFAHDLWKNRVLPVWRQVMGKHGGWHEGGEYVGIGIGQAIYQVPAMWRKATGEDFFRREPGIRGFLDFLVYRTRPDGTHFRWGDAAHFDRAVPDRIPLAIEYGHRPVYSLERPPPLQPTAWPWGPLPRSELFDPESIKGLPLARYFDGLGLIVARSDWSPEATYVTFKAGDNYWSHSHLDQGAFTIYKGGALAIDSGLYGPRYGSDHHMNYTYQTIAHNSITITDPRDTVLAPAPKGEQRPIANDGGQRRIGSGWGVEAAPLDLDEWQQKREIYHTGTMHKVFMQDGLVVALADVTPAYTNRHSGRWTFSHRARRVERLWRVFAYDQIDDAIVVFDQVRAARADFRKRWLLHTIEQPIPARSGFTVFIAPGARSGHAGGRLRGHVLLPRAAEVQTIGGKALAFFVDDANYDEGGKVAEAAAGRPGAEPGAWRIEVSPSVAAEEDMFLVVLLPTPGPQSPKHQVQLIESEGKIGCEIIGAKRITRWLFTPGANEVRLELLSGNSTRRYEISAGR